MANRLKSETSPYLRQHADHPVDWYLWGEEAFDRARREDKPVFLSVGYSTCHWCHVMAHECFEDDAVAGVLNEHFICIKVDKEERPDVDALYMAACQVMTGSGGWPNSIFLTPDQQPFYAGTYFPKPAFLQLLDAIRQAWAGDRKELLHQSRRVLKHIMPQPTKPATADRTLADLAVAVFSRLYDSEYGGFGRAPKFPSAHNLLFLLRYYERYQNKSCLAMAEKTLVQMYRGGLFDHVGGGFCRYSTDRQFLVPHFEKMLYDNALLILAYCKAYTLTQKPLYRDIACKTADYILREMTAPTGGFYSAQDADSEGEEGKYYLFDKQEILDLLGERGEGFCRQFGIREQGNFEGKNIPNRLGSDPDNMAYDDGLPILAAYRKTRYALHRDDKILTFWNGLMIAALCHLYRITADETYRNAAKTAEGYLQEHSQGEWLTVSVGRQVRPVGGFLEDYAGRIFGLLALHDMTLEEQYRARAIRLCDYVLAHFADKDGGFFLSGDEGEQLLIRQKETYDGATPSGNSLMAYNLVRLHKLTGGYERETADLLAFLAGQAKGYPSNHTMFLLALLNHTDPPVTITVVSDSPIDLAALARCVPEGTVCTWRAPDRSYPLKNGQTTYYVCRDGRCLPPENVCKV